MLTVTKRLSEEIEELSQARTWLEEGTLAALARFYKAAAKGVPQEAMQDRRRLLAVYLHNEEIAMRFSLLLGDELHNRDIPIVVMEVSYQTDPPRPLLFVHFQGVTKARVSAVIELVTLSVVSDVESRLRGVSAEFDRESSRMLFRRRKRLDLLTEMADELVEAREAQRALMEILTPLGFGLANI